MGRRTWDEKTYRATWEDVDNWVQALYEDHHCRLDLDVRLPGPGLQGSAAVDVELYTPGVGATRIVRWRGYSPLDLRAPHHAEHVAVQLLSKAWLELDLEKQAAERQQALFGG